MRPAPWPCGSGKHWAADEPRAGIALRRHGQMDAMKPQILYEDNHLLVVIKPFNVPVQADASGDLDLLTFYKAYIKQTYHKPGDVYLGLVRGLRPSDRRRDSVCQNQQSGGAAFQTIAAAPDAKKPICCAVFARPNLWTAPWRIFF